MAVVKISSGQLPASTSIVQALDNQWVPEGLLRDLAAARKTRDDCQDAIDQLARIELIRALINSRSVVINRAVMLNTHLLDRDLALESKRPFMGRLLSEQALVPFLFREGSLAEKPLFSLSRPAVLDDLQELEQHYDVHCVRLSWDDRENDRLSKDLLASRFHRFAGDLYQVDLDVLVATLGLPAESVEPLRKVLTTIRRAVGDYYDAEGRHITREVLYRQFVCADAPDAVARGAYDTSRPFALELKQLFDLRYVLNLPDALRVNALTAQDSMSRSSLPMEDQRFGPVLDLDPRSLVERVLALRQFEFITEQIARADVRHLELEDVVALRDRSEWKVYAAALELLLQNPFRFSDDGVGLANVVRHWVPVNRLVAELSAKRVGHHTIEKLDRFVMALSFGVAGIGSVLKLSILGHDLVAKVYPRRLDRLRARATRLLGSFMVHSKAVSLVDEAESEQQFISHSVKNGEEYFNDVLERFRDAGIAVEYLNEQEAADADNLEDQTSDTSRPEEE